MDVIRSRATSFWSRYRVPLLIYGVSRLAVFLIAIGIARWRHVRLICSYLDAHSCAILHRDPYHYDQIVRQGYQATHVVSHLDSVGFFPGYPAFLRVISLNSHISVEYTALAINFFIGAITAILLWKLSLHFLNADSSKWVQLFFWFCPTSFFLSLMFGEVLAFPLLIAALLALLNRRWAWAGFFAAGATFSRPNALLVEIPCAFYAIDALRTRREWRALFAPLIAPVGFLLYCLYLWRKYDDFFLWFRVQKAIWGQKFALDVIPQIFNLIPVEMITVSTALLVFGVLSIAIWRSSVPKSMAAMCVLMFIESIAVKHQFPRFRILMMGIPFFIVLAEKSTTTIKRVVLVIFLSEFVLSVGWMFVLPRGNY